jgi:hypothetical protein
MSDSSIPSDLVDQNTVKLRQVEERQQARLQEQSEWRRSNTLLCDCINCINARERELKKETDVKESVRRPPAPALPKQPDISHLKIPDIRSLFRFLLPSDEANDTASIFSSN